MKARVVPNPTVAEERQLSIFRSWEFDAAVVVLFDDEFRVWRGTRLPVAVLKQAGRLIEHVNGYRVMATDDLLAQGEDWTDPVPGARGWFRGHDLDRRARAGSSTATAPGKGPRASGALSLSLQADWAYAWLRDGCARREPRFGTPG